mgnify:CR=1 FL=1
MSNGTQDSKYTFNALEDLLIKHEMNSGNARRAVLNFVSNMVDSEREAYVADKVKEALVKELIEVDLYTPHDVEKMNYINGRITALTTNKKEEQ